MTTQLAQSVKTPSRGHLVRFYETELYLFDTVGRFLKEGLDRGEAVIVIATPKHRAGFEQALRAGGVDLESATNRGQITVLDAEETLSEFMVGGLSGTPDPEAFTTVVGGLMDGITDAGRYPQLRAYGEMVDVLFRYGNETATTRLEELWNDLAETRSFQLVCAYRIGGFDRAAHAAAFHRVCNLHGQVVPSESYRDVATPEEHCRQIAELQQRARALETEIAERERVQAERDALVARERAAREEAERANRLKDEFLAIVSHELRTPLNAIVGWAHVLRSMDGLSPDQVRNALETIERNARIQSQIVSDILDISRITSGKLLLDQRQADLNDVLTAAVETVRPAALAKKVDLRASYPADVAFIWADSDRLQQALWNLLANAVKFTPAGGRVDAVLSRQDSCVEIAVSDTGQGIAPTFLPLVFERFRQADSSSSRRHGGLGLGLAIVKHVVELHGGRVEAESPGEGRGSTFRIKLPILPVLTDPTSIPTPDIVTTAVRLDGVSVLLVDDHDDGRAIVATILGQLGAIVITAASAAQALALLQAKRPDVIVSDIEMPEETGYDLLEKVRALSAGHGGLTPAIALTAYARSEDRIRALAAGYHLHVSKPARTDQLVAAISELVGRTRTRP